MRCVHPRLGLRLLSTGPSTTYRKATHIPKPLPENTPDPKRSEFVLPVYARPQDIVIHRGEGSYLFARGGLKYLDFGGGIAVNALGHGDAEFLQVLETQARQLIHSSNVYHNEHAPHLAEQLVRLTRTEGGLGWQAPSLRLSISPAQQGSSAGAQVFFGNSGTEANEGALKIARMAGKHRWAARTGKPWETAGPEACDKYRLVCFQRGFHGRSMGALSMTSTAKYQAPFMPLLPGVDVGQINDVAGLGGLVTEATCGVIVEPIQGEGGVHVADVEWLRALRRRCDEVGAVLIYDEIQCGLYRTGTLWAHSSYPNDCHPDIITMAKPLANGYPIGAVLMRDSVAQYMTAGTHGTTFGGSPLACALAKHVLSRISHPKLKAQVEAISKHLHARLRKLPEWFPDLVGPKIRGRGLIAGIPFLEPANAVRLVQIARERGLFVLTAGTDAVRLIPSLTITTEQVDFAVDVIESGLAVMRET